MSAGVEHANRLEQWFQSAPDPVQQVLRPVFDPANDLLKSVSGDPADLVRAGHRYVDLGREIVRVAEEQRLDRRMLAGGAWDGEGFEAFTARAEEIERQLESIGEVTGGTQEVLEAAAQACVEGANLIIDIIVTLIAFAIGTFVIKAALAALTFGASMAAWVAEQVAAGAVALARITQVVTKVATFLQRVAAFLRRLADTLRGLAALFKELRLLLQQLDELKKTAKAVHGFFSKAHLASMGVRGAGYGITNATVLGGTVPRPLGSTLGAAGSVRDTVEAVQEVDESGQG